MPPMCDAEPTPAVPTLALSGFAFSQPMSSRRSFDGEAGLATISSGLLAIIASGSRSASKSYDSGYTAPLITCVLQWPMLSVYPSGAAFATRPTATVPAAPVMFSTSTVWPNAFPIGAATIRAIVSTGPPAAKGTIIVIGLEGYACAEAFDAKAVSAQMAKSFFINIRMHEFGADVATGQNRLARAGQGAQSAPIQGG